MRFPVQRLHGRHVAVVRAGGHGGRLVGIEHDVHAAQDLHLDVHVRREDVVAVLQVPPLLNLDLPHAHALAGLSGQGVGLLVIEVDTDEGLGVDCERKRRGEMCPAKIRERSHVLMSGITS
jgi:hypothetical protein